MTNNFFQIRIASIQPPGRPVKVAVATVLALLGFAATFFGPEPAPVRASSTIPIYENALDTNAKRAEAVKVGKGNCKKGKGSKGYRFSLGKKTTECAYRLPVVGSSIEISGTGVLFGSTPSKIINRTYLALSTRQADNGSRYQLAVFPSRKRVELRKVGPNGGIELLARENDVRQVKPPGASNRLTLRTFNRVSGLPAETARVVARINGKRVALFDDPAGLGLAGRTNTFSIGSSASANGAAGSFRAIEVRIPDPFG